MTRTSGFLTVLSSDRQTVYGEFPDADWTDDSVHGTVNHMFTGAAGDGVAEAFRQLNDAGISHVAYTFEANGVRYAGQAELLAPKPGIVVIETGTTPVSE